MIYAPAIDADIHQGQRIRQGLAALLLELRGVLSGLTQVEYTLKPVGPIKASLGGHVRHSLDHIETAITNGAGELNYDHRSRGTPVESDRIAAIQKIDALFSSLAQPETSPMPQGAPLMLYALVSADGDPVAVQSSRERELLFAFSHTLHHNALIRVMVELLGGSVPERFGYAPATLTYMDSNACAR